ncbi:MAG: hypothetical protein LBV43_07060 [Prevotella sp.]|jgi:hypothetical protein|nr:hypothetical protein [Prevotella sp.]
MKACISFTMAALLFPLDIEAWVNATGRCLVTNFTHQESFIINIINCAYHYNNEEYVNALLNNPNFQNLPANSPFEQLIDSVIAISRHNNEEKEIRIFDDLSGDEIPIS